MLEVECVNAKTIVTRTKSSLWFDGDFNMNIYKGCSHGCIYCDSRSECYGIDDFDTVKPKKDALLIINEELRKKRKTGVVMTGAMSDPYNPLEKRLSLTREALALIERYGFGAGIATKSPLIVRDIDVLRAIADNAPVIAKITITSACDTLSKQIEPRAPTTPERLKAVAALSESGIFTGILMMPILPFLQDNEKNIKQIIELSHEAGAKFICAWFGVTLRDRQRAYFYDKLDAETRQKYISAYGNEYNCTSANFEKLWDFFSTECEKYGIIYKMREIIQAYKTSFVSKRQMTIFSYLEDLK